MKLQINLIFLIKPDKFDNFTHKLDSFKDINIENLELRPIIDQTGTATYHASKVVVNYLRPLTSNKFLIKDCLSFPDIL